MKRDNVEQREIDAVLEAVKQSLLRRLDQHGWGKFVGPHEALGVLTEEWKECIDAAQDNNNTELAKEMLDIAISGIWGYLSLIEPTNKHQSTFGIY